MFLQAPNQTPYDLRFSVLGFPVRVHPLFWLMCLFVGSSNDPKQILTTILVFFVSILIHELGHALMIRRFGGECYIVLYGFGGLAIEGSDNPYKSSYNPRSERRTAQEQIYISLAGPAAGFALAALVLVFAKGMGGDVKQVWFYNIVPAFFILPHGNISPELAAVLSSLLYINIWWGVVNLLPVYPLDGGQVAMQLLMLRDPDRGFVQCLQLGIVVGIGMVIFALTVMQSFYTAMLFGSLAVSLYINYMQIHGRGHDNYR